VAVFEPVGEREDLLPERSERLVERQEIQRRLLRHLLRGEGRPLLLRGGPGLGKTALLEWALAAVQVKGRPCVRVPLGPHSVSKPYAAWRGPLRALLGVRREDPAEAVRNALGARFSGEGARYSSLLCPLLDLPEENSAAVGALGASERRDLTFALMRDLLKRDRGVSLLFDNVQWADPLSLDLLVLLLEGAPENPVRLAATLRPGFPEVEARLEGAQVLDLPPLSDKGLQKLLTEGQGFLPPEPEVTGWFAQRSRGNPAVAMALVTALDAAGCIQRGSWGARLDGDRLFRTRFPDTLEGLYLAPLDRLGAAEKRLLQQAAVLGVSISVNLLREVSGLPEEEAAALLSALEHARLLLPDTWGVRPYARFADALLRDAVYAATPFEVKRDIHARMARFLEQDGGSVPKMWPALAHHYRAAGDETSARRYARLAGRDAYARADPLTALEHLERVCRPPTAEPEDVEDAFRLLDVYEGLGKWADAGPVLAELERLEGTLALPHRARLRNYLAIERPEEAEALLLEGVRLADEAGDVLLGAKARLNLVGRVYGPTGRTNEAKSHLHSVLAAPEVPGMVLLKGVSLMNLGNAHWFGGDPASGERYLRQSAQVFRRAGLPHRESAVANNLAALYSESGKFPKVIWWARRSMASGRMYSGRGAYEASRTNLASALLAGGMAEQALRTTQHSLKESQSRNARSNMAHAQYRTAYAAFQLGDIHRVIESSLSAFDLFKNLNMGRFVLPSLNPVFRLYHQLGLRERARGFWEDSVQNLSHFRGSLEDAPSLEVIHFEAWISPSECSQATPAMSADLPPNETSDGLCWQLEDAMASGDRARLEGALDHLEGHLPRWPHIEAKWAAALGRRLSAGRMSREERHRCERLLRRCAGGVHGLRLIAFLLQEKGLDARGRWERIASRRLAFVRQHSPPWAWEALLRFPEVRALAERPAWGRDRAEKGPAERRRARAARSKKAKGKSS
jgi:tetratricopeptide (TPR) repeat protein